jgi:hypothetical protein
MPSTISTAGLPQFSESETLYKSHIETAIDTAGLVTMSAATASNDGFLTKESFATFTAKQTATLADGKILAGNASNVATAVTPSGVVSMANTGVFTFSTNFDNVATTDSNGKLIIANMTSSGGAVVMALAATGTNVVTHCTPATGTLTVNVNGTTNVLASTSVAYHVCKL